MKLDNVLHHGNKKARHLGVVYHLTLERNLPSIRQHGLLPRRGNANYQYPTPRIFLTDNLSEDTLERVGSIVLTGGRSAAEMESNPPTDRLVALRVKIDNWPHDVFVDDKMGMVGCFYTDHPIPTDRLMVVGCVDFTELKIVPM